MFYTEILFLVRKLHNSLVILSFQIWNYRLSTTSSVAFFLFYYLPRHVSDYPHCSHPPIFSLSAPNPPQVSKWQTPNEWRNINSSRDILMIKWIFFCQRFNASEIFYFCGLWEFFVYFGNFPNCLILRRRELWQNLFWFSKALWKHLI